MITKVMGHNLTEPTPAEPSLAAGRSAIRSGPAPTWSVIVIARNEETRIRRCLQSVIDAMRPYAHEIILVDSASTDDTAAIGRAAGVEILDVPGDFPLSPAAGRHLGFLRARGTYLLFMDGDSILDPAWVAPAMRALQEDRVAGVAGLREVVDARSGRTLAADQYGSSATARTISENLGGPAAYARQALVGAGGFNPFMKAYEEAELGGRLRAAGYSLCRLPMRMTTHVVEHPHETVRDLMRRVRSGYPYARGQLLRYGLRHRCVGRLHLEGLDRLAVFAALVVALLAGVIVLVATGKVTLLLIALAALAVLFVVFAAKTGNVRKPAYYFLEWAIHVPMFIRGFSMRPRTPAEYPALDDPPS